MRRAAGTPFGYEEASYQLDEALNERLLLKVERAALALDLSRSQVAEMIATGELPSIKIGRARRIPVAALRECIAKQSGA